MCVVFIQTESEIERKERWREICGEEKGEEEERTRHWMSQAIRTRDISGWLSNSFSTCHIEFLPL